MEGYLIIIIIISMLFSAFFSGIEIAFYQANPLKVELDKSQDSYTAKVSSFFFQKPSRFITNTLIGNNIALIIYGLVFTRFFESLYPVSGIFGITNQFISFLIITFLSTTIILIFSEFLPKALFIINPNKMLRSFILPFSIIYYLLLPVNLLLVFFSKSILRVFRIRINEQKPTFDYYDLFHLVTEESERSIDDNSLELDTQILKNVIELPKVKVRECMVPRPEIVAIDAEDSINDLRKLFIESGHTKILVYQENIDQIIGYVHMIDLYDKPDSIRKIIKPVFIVAESMAANVLLKKFTSSNKSIGLVVDEYGGTAGIVSIEDILEEIFGEIQDEFDYEGLKEVKVNDFEYILSTRLEIDYLNEKYNFEFPEGDYETLGGLILSIHQSIPARQQIISFGHFTIKVLSASRHRVDEILLKISPEKDQ